MNKIKFNNLLNTLSQQADSVMRIISKLQNNNVQQVGFIYAKSNLIRLRSSFSVIKTIIKKGYAIESFVLIRFIHEQISYSYSLRLVQESTDIDNISVTKSINQYKDRIDTIARVYGELSQFSHLSMEKINYIFEVSINKQNHRGKISVMMAHDDKDIGYNMICNYGYAVMLYLDMVFVFLDVDDLRSNNEWAVQRAERIRTKLYATINYMIGCIPI